MAVLAPTTVILRFRDLTTPRGDTVRLHNDISAASGFVWWAWWNKAGEKVPEQTFRRLREQARADSLTVYLFDSGQNLLYRATCTDIVWDVTLQDIPSPARDQTPIYYRDQQYPVWFKLGALEAQPEAALAGWTYVRVDEFFVDRTSPYGPFYGKQVSSLAELQQQQRSIWFVRPFLAGDKTHVVSLLEANVVEPADFPSHRLAAASTRILWLSDLHFSAAGNQHGFPVAPTPARLPLAQRIERALQPDKTLGGVLITGDLTWQATTADYGQARAFLRELQSWSSLSTDRIALLPGNHDLAFSARPADPSAPVTATSEVAREPYAKFYEDVFHLRPNRHLASGRRFLLGNAIPVDLLCLNSSSLQQASGDFQGHGFIGEEQLDFAAGSMAWGTQDNDLRAFRVVALHHHVLPVTFREEPVRGRSYSVVLDASALLRWAVRMRVDLIVHGHMHQPAVARLQLPLEAADPSGGSWTISVAAMGSTGVSPEHLGAVAQNTFGLLDFSRNGATLTLRTVHPTNESTSVWSYEIPWGRVSV